MFTNSDIKTSIQIQYQGQNPKVRHIHFANISLGCYKWQPKANPPNCFHSMSQMQLQSFAQIVKRIFL